MSTQRNQSAGPTPPKKNGAVKSPLKKQVWHLAIISGIAISLAYQMVISRAQLVDLHYQIETLEYEIGKLETEKAAYYQHQAELTKLSRLKEAMESESAELEGARIYRLEPKPHSK